MDKGSSLVDRTGQKMNEVISAIRGVKEIMGEISAASQLQGERVSQVSNAIGHMDRNTQQNAALVEQMAAAATGLKSQAADLVGVVVTFNLTGLTLDSSQ